MAFSDQLLELGEEIWQAQYEHPFVVELAEGTLDEDAFRFWVEQDYRYLLDYARLFSVAGAKARDEETMTHLLGVAHTVLDHELDLHRSFAEEYGITERDLEAVEKAPVCGAYTDFLVRTAYEGSIAEIAAAMFPCMQGYHDVGQHAAEIASETHRYTPWIETYTGDEFAEATAWCRSFVDRCGEQYPGEHEAMERAFLRSARLEHRFWEMCYRQEEWTV